MSGINIYFMKTITLSNSSEVAICDDDTYEKALSHNTTWFLQDSGVHCRSKITGDKIALHRLALSVEDRKKYLDVDHINRNKLDNQKSNLRLCEHHLNLVNCVKSKGVTSKYKGVSWHKKAQKFQVILTCRGIRYYRGLFVNEQEAAQEANKLMLEIHGKYAVLNII